MVKHISRTIPAASKPYLCAACGETIERGELHVKLVSKIDGAFSSIRFHSRCDSNCPSCHEESTVPTA